ncbi:MAG: archaetidylserine decarboxylase [Verrucomicrobiota bacterium]|nr:archaetidylserine decarboxylase [Verrucomicrobiota bacterium]
MNDIFFYNRETKELQKELVMDERYIKWAYQSDMSCFFSSIFFRFSLFSSLIGTYFDSRFSIKKIAKTVDDLNMDISDAERNLEDFLSFNDFFTRKLKRDSRPYSAGKDVLVSPGDGRISILPKIDKGLVIPLKGREYSLDELFAEDASDFYAGSMAVIRLCPVDYHRYHYPLDAKVTRQKKIRGKYHSVNPLALKTGIKIFCENKRNLTFLDNPVFGKIVFMEIGAFGVSSIIDTNMAESVKKMDEKGYFKFGGSTIVLIFKKNKITFSKDLCENSDKGYETLVKAGETIGKAKNE